MLMNKWWVGQPHFQKQLLSELKQHTIIYQYNVHLTGMYWVEAMYKPGFIFKTIEDTS